MLPDQQSTSLPVTDAYLHCGIHKYQPVEQVRRVMEQAGVQRGILVQHLNEYDNSYIRELVVRYPGQFAGVGLIAQDHPEAVEQIYAMRQDGVLRGIRLTLDSLAAHPELWEAAAAAELIIVIYAPEGISCGVHGLCKFMAANPQVRVVLTHMGNPAPADGPDFQAYQPFWNLASAFHFYFQISGMAMFCPFPHASLYPLIAAAEAALGPRRLLWGSNYPVVGGIAEYSRDLGLLLDGRLPLSPGAVELIANGNALELWFE